MSGRALGAERRLTTTTCAADPRQAQRHIPQPARRAGDRCDLEVGGRARPGRQLLAPVLPSRLAGRLTRLGRRTARGCRRAGRAGRADAAGRLLGSGVASARSGLDCRRRAGHPAAGPRPAAEQRQYRLPARTPVASAADQHHPRCGLGLNWCAVGERHLGSLYAERLRAGPGRPGPSLRPRLSGNDRVCRSSAAPFHRPGSRWPTTTSLLRSALEGVTFAVRDALDALLEAIQEQGPAISAGGQGHLAGGGDNCSRTYWAPAARSTCEQPAAARPSWACAAACSSWRACRTRPGQPGGGAWPGGAPPSPNATPTSTMIAILLSKEAVS